MPRTLTPLLCAALLALCLARIVRAKAAKADATPDTADPKINSPVAEGAAPGVDEVATHFDLGSAALLKLKVRHLKAMLARKGAFCNACSSKRDLIERIEEVRGDPDVPKDTPAPEKDEPFVIPSMEFGSKESGDMNQKMENLREAMKKNGMGIPNMKMYTRDDIDKLRKDASAAEAAAGASDSNIKVDL
jgi:hypothetical protein